MLICYLCRVFFLFANRIMQNIGVNFNEILHSGVGEILAYDKQHVSYILGII